ncbi:MAG: hypothetical protein RIS70_1323 [Planctomycetota bacterium]
MAREHRDRGVGGSLRVACYLAIAFLLSRTTTISASDRVMQGPLVDYVRKEDKVFAWTKKGQGKIGDTSYTELILTSQKWRDIVWKHQLFIIKPSSVPADARQAMLFVAGGSWRPELEDASTPTKLPREAPIFATIAEQLKSPIAVLLHVPQQPIFDGKQEDAIIAYTFEEFMRTKDPEWPLLLPMVKSAVRAMDAVEQVCKAEWNLGIESFTVTGGSKRGWTTWLTGAVDPRATAIAPMVIDMLNMAPQMKLQRESFGKPSEMIDDYTKRGLDKVMDTPSGQALRDIVDPFSYRKHLTQPKLVILGTNDPYWPLDAANLYWDELVGSKYLLYCPNNGHGVNDLPRLAGGLAAIHQHAVTGKPLPKLTWEFSNGNGRARIHVASDVKPEKVSTWTAVAASKDFRNAKWESKPATEEAGKYVCEVQVPANGYTAVFGEAVYAGEPLPYFFSTNVRIISANATP